MRISNQLARNAHFLGTKIRNLRKRNGLTMDDLSSRCIRIDAQLAPSVSYLSMIERGKRVPSHEMLEVIAKVFQKDVDWFLDDVSEQDSILPDKGSQGGIAGMSLEPKFLFEQENLQIAIPELLSQAGVSGQQFAHLLIRAHQERNKNHFPDLERAAEKIGRKRLPISLDEILDICKSMGLKLHWFKRKPEGLLDELGGSPNNLVRSFFVAPNKIFVNEALKHQPQRLKYDLAVQIGHVVLHGGDGVKGVMVAGQSSSTRGVVRNDDLQASIDTQDIIHAWRDFECSFFAAALLCPKVAFRQLLDRHHYDISVGKLIDVSESVVMRRMTSVSPYDHWHYFDAYPPGKLRAVYRGNGIPLPWGNMRMVQDPCQHWAVFRMLDKKKQKSAQISILDVNNKPRIYSCESVSVSDLGKNPHVLCAGVDLNPALDNQGIDSESIAHELKEVCATNGGTSEIPANIRKSLTTVANILNIGWVDRGIENRARVICPRSSDCPRDPCCSNTESPSKEMSLEKIQAEIIASSN